MANCIDTLEAILGSADCKLDSILYHLQHRVSQSDINYDSANDCETIVLNCVEMISTFKEIQNDLQEIKSEYKVIKEMENDLNNKLLDKCLQIEEKVKELKHNISYK